MDGTSLLKKASSIFERDKSDPYTVTDVDRFLGTIATLLPIIVLAIAIFLGGDMYNVDGLAVYNPNNIQLGGRHYETWNQMPYIRLHCWSALTNTDCFDGECKNKVNLFHYSIVPYFLFAITLLMYTTKALWQLGKATEMSNKVNYLIGGIEEAVRDVLEYLISSAENISSEENYDQVKRTLVVEQNLSKDVMSNAARKEKYQILNSMMKEYSTQQKYTTFFTLARIYFVVIVAAVNIGTWYLYLNPAQNPVSFDCPLPEWLYYEDTIANVSQTFTTVHAVFEPVARRTLLMYIMFAIYCVIFVASVIGWAQADSSNPGMDLLEKLPGLDRFDTTGFNDLRYLMKLVYTNRKRVKFLRLAFDTMIAVQRNDALTGDANDRYYSALREITLWSITDESDKELDKLITRQVENIKSEE